MADRGTPAPFDGEALETWAALGTILEWLPAALDTQLQRDSDMSHFEYGVLFALSTAPHHTLRMSVLAGYSNSSLSRLSRAVKRLEQKSWVQRAIDSSDGRYTLATLTASGANQVVQATPGHRETIDRLVLSPLTGTQRRQLKEISRRISAAIRPEGDWRPPSARHGQHDPE